MIVIIALLIVLVFQVSMSNAQEKLDPLVEINKHAYFYGREYFVLRSGRTQMVVQADKADIGPAFTYMLFDPQNASQNAKKETAYNFDPAHGVSSSALEVVLGGCSFTALGHRTETHWVASNGIPMVEAIWWAGGIRVTERIWAIEGAGAFQRSIVLEGAHLVGEEAVTLVLTLPEDGCRFQSSILFGKAKSARVGLMVLGNYQTKANEKENQIEVGPIAVVPDGVVMLETVLLVQAPSGEEQEFLAAAADVSSGADVGARSRTLAKWEQVSSITTRDETVQNIFDKARFGLPGMVADDGTMDAGIFEYGDQWVRDTSNTILGMIHTGEFGIARRTIERMLTKMISKDGVTMISGSFDSPDLEQFDQMGELLHVLKAYRDWTGDDSPVRDHRELLLALIERPLQPKFRDETGMVHNKREFWERAFDDAYELAYQTWVIQGLRDAAELAPALSAEDRAMRWRTEADRMLKSMLAHPTRSLVDNGRLIKRRNVTGEVVDMVPTFRGWQPDDPGTTEKHHRLLPDSSQALPIAFRIVDPESSVAGKTLDELELLWNTRWNNGGYDRYHTSSQGDQPGPWSFATCFIMRAQHEAGRFEMSRRSLEWLNTVQGGRTGAWFEEIPSTRSIARTSGILPWTSGEVALFVVRHWLGVRFEGSRLALRPALYPGTGSVTARLRYKKGWIQLEVDSAGPVIDAVVNGKVIKPGKDGTILLPADFTGGTVRLRTEQNK